MSFIENILLFDTEYTKVRVGDKHDGGYVVLDEISQKCHKLFSYGVETNSSFENEFVEKYDCDAHLFDHTVEQAAEINPRFSFDKEGLSHITTEDCDTLENHMIKYGCHRHKLNMTLKMDIEWCEWDVFDQMPDEVLTDFDQILCEFHLIPVKYKDSHSPYFTAFHQSVYDKVNDLLFEKYLKVLDRIQQHYYAFHVHVNNSIPCNTVNYESIPPLVELSFVKKTLVKEPKYSSGHFPVEGLDYPNKTDRPDIVDIVWNP